jgi:hypothetical protein
MTHFIIKLVGASITLAKRRGDFTFLAEHNALVYQGREIPIAEHNELVPKVMERYKDYMPRLPQVILLAAPLVKPKAPKVEPVAEEPPTEPTAPLEPEAGAGAFLAPEPSPEFVEPDPSGVSAGVFMTEEIQAPPTVTPDPETAPEVADSVPAPDPEPQPAPPVEDPAPAPPKKKGGRPPKYGPGGALKP